MPDSRPQQYQYLQMDFVIGLLTNRITDLQKITVLQVLVDPTMAECYYQVLMPQAPNGNRISEIT